MMIIFIILAIIAVLFFVYQQNKIVYVRNSDTEFLEPKILESDYQKLLEEEK